MKQKIFAYFADESGQTSTEYILLVAVAAAIVIKFKGAIMGRLIGDENGNGGLLGDVMNGVSSQITREFQ
jgi:Flp pilus assembly pilin Flp